MSEVVYTDPGPKIEIKIEETAKAGTSMMPTPGLEDDADAEQGVSGIEVSAQTSGGSGT